VRTRRHCLMCQSAAIAHCQASRPAADVASCCDLLLRQDRRSHQSSRKRFLFSWEFVVLVMSSLCSSRHE